MAELPSREAAEPPVVAAASIASTANAGAVEQKIDPWSVSAAIDEQGNSLAFDYEAISRKWATSLIDQTLLDRFERITGHKPHRWLRRGLFFSHRDFDKILDYYEKGKPFLLYTGRGPSGDSLHIGHTIPFEFTKWLQDVFDVPLVIMLTDDEKFLFKDKLTVEETIKFSEENAKDIIAMGFDLKKTFIYSDFKYMGGHFYQNCIEFSRLLPTNQVRGAFGFDGTTNIGRVFFPAVQCVAAFATSYPEVFGDSPLKPRQKRTAAIPCLIPCAIDQDPYFRLLRDNSHRMKNPSPKPALIHSKFLTALQGPGGKMSASDPTSAIFMNDSKKDVQKKINKYAFSGGRATVEEHRKLGGNPDVDVPYQYLTYFLDDDAELERIYNSYKSGEMLTGEIKQICTKLMQEYVEGYQARRKTVSEEVLQSYMTPRRLQWGGNKNAVKLAAGQPASTHATPQAGQKSSQPAPAQQQPPPQSATQLPPTGEAKPAPAAPADTLNGTPAQTQGGATIEPNITTTATEVDSELELERSRSFEHAESPGLAKLRGKGYGIGGLTRFSESIGGMLYGNDEGSGPSSTAG